VSDASGRAGVTGTPTVMLNGKVIESKTLTTADALVAMIKAAKS
jgi:protein-disulfide isomerase